MASDDLNIFKILYDKVGDMVIPPGNAGNETLLLCLPGVSIDADSYDLAKTPEADENAARLVDIVPRLDNHFVPSGKTASAFARHFITAGSAPGDAQDLDDDRLDRLQERVTKRMVEEKKAQAAYSESSGKLEEARQKVLAEVDQAATSEEKERIWRRYQGDPKIRVLIDNASSDEDNYSIAMQATEGARAALKAFTSGNLNTLWSAASAEARKSENNRASGRGKFFKTTFEPADWWKSFRGEKSGAQWLGFTATSQETYSSSKEHLSKTSASATAKFGGLGYGGSASVGWSKEEGASSSIEGGSNTKIGFEVARVLVSRDWVGPLWSLMEYEGIGIKGVGRDGWSTGELDWAKNKGAFPLIITGLILARNLVVSSDKWTKTASEQFKKEGLDISARGGWGPFSANGNYHKDTFDKSTDAKSTFDGQTLTIAGPQIIGFVATVNPAFPRVDLSPKKPDAGALAVLPPLAGRAAASLAARTFFSGPTSYCCLTQKPNVSTSPLRVMLDTHLGYIPLWHVGTTLTYAFDETWKGPHLEAHMEVIASSIRIAASLWKLGEAVRFVPTEVKDKASFLVTYQVNDQSSESVLAQGYFPSDQRGQFLTIFKYGLEQPDILVNTLCHELGHILGLRHEFALDLVHPLLPGARNPELAWSSVRYGSIDPVSVMSYHMPPVIDQNDLTNIHLLYSSERPVTQIENISVRRLRPWNDAH